MFRLLSVLLMLLASPCLAREIGGTLAYKPRIALPQGVEMVVELRADGIVLGELRDAVGDRQVPLAFSIATDQTGPLMLRGALFSEGRMIWISDPHPIPPGDDPVDLGAVPLYPHAEMGFATPLRCGSLTVALAATPLGLRLRASGAVIDLTPAGNGFTDGETPATLLNRDGNRIQISLRGTPLPACEPMIDSAPLPMTARGHEPGWVLTLARQGVTFSAEDGETLTAGLPAPTLTDAGAILRIAENFTVVVSETQCHDAVTGLPYPASVSINREAGSFVGCGGDPMALMQGEWVVTEVEGAALPPEAETTLALSGNRIAGVSACNRYTGSAVVTADGLRFSRIAGTKMACPAPLMAVEATYLQALSKVTGFDFDEDGQLVLLSADQTILRARR